MGYLLPARASGAAPGQDERLLVPAPTSRAEIDAALSVLAACRARWPLVQPAERAAILDQVRHDMVAVAERWIGLSLAAKGNARRSFAEAEEWVFFAIVARAIRLLSESLRATEKHGRPLIAGPVAPRPSGQITVRVIPHDHWDRILFHGITGEVWIEPGESVDDVLRTQAWAYRERRAASNVGLVLGAGNASMIPVVDMLHKLFVENRLVVLKLNPVNAYLGPLIEEGFRTLIRHGVLRVVYGGSEEGSYLCRHPEIDELHMTGSSRTFEAISFGEGAAGRQRRAARRPLNTKPFSCELGNVSPVIIVPGPWSRGDVQHQAEQIATWLVANAGFGCLTPRVIIQHRDWPLRWSLTDAIGAVLAGVATRDAYYPGAVEQHQRVVAAHPEARRFGMADDRRLPWTLITDLDPSATDDICFTQESFCSVLAETALEAPDVAAFVDRSVEFANTTLWGTLNATLIVHPASLRNPEVAAAVERAVGDLRYGTVLINMFALAGYYFQVTPWGGFPGADIYDSQSGIGKTGNALMFARPQKCVIRAPFRRRIDSLRVTSAHAHQFARQLAYFELAPAWSKLPGLFWAALRH